MKMYENMTKCNQLIREACGFQLSPENETFLDNCKKITDKYRKGADECKKKPNNCSCWADLEKSINNVKKCTKCKYK